MNEIVEIDNFEFGSCIKIRKKLPQQDITMLINELELYIKQNNLFKIGNPFSGIHENNSNYATGEIDIEIIQPIEFQPPLNETSSIETLDNLVIKHSLHYEHVGNPQFLKNSADTLMNYVTKHNYNVVTPIFNLPVVVPKSLNDIDSSVYKLILGIEK